MIKYAILLAVVLVLAGSPHGRSCPPATCPATGPATCGSACTCGCTPARASPTLFSLWLRWGRLAVLRRSGRIRPALPLRYRLIDPREHSVFLGRAHYRHGLRVPLEEHLLVMAPPGPSRLRSWLMSSCATPGPSSPPPLSPTSTP